MSTKVLSVLVVLLAVLAGALWMSGRGVPSEGPGAGSLSVALLPGVDLSTIESITIESGSATTHLVKADGIWCVSGEDQRPADLSRMRELIRSIDAMGKGLLVEDGTEHLEAYGLVETDDSSSLRITLGDGVESNVLSLGNRREAQSGSQLMRMRPGRYARVDNGPVLLLKEDVRMAQADPDFWWDRVLLSVPSESIRQIELDSAEGTYAIQRDTNGVYTLVGGTEEETVEVPSATRLFSALRNLRAEKILSADGKEDVPEFKAVLSCTAETEGVTYSIQMDEARSDMGGGRLVKITVEAQPDATPEQQATATHAAAKLHNRIYLIPPYQANLLEMKKKELISKQKSPPEPSPEPPVPVN